MKSIYIERVTPTETPTPNPTHMEFSSSPAVNFANLRKTTIDAMEHLRRLRHLTCPESRAFHIAKLARLEQAAQVLEDDLNVGAMPSDVWFDTPPNEWWEAN